MCDPIQRRLGVSDRAFHDLIRQIENRNQQAAAEFLEIYGPHIRRIARVRLTDNVMRRLVDSMDIYQSVMAIFFSRATAGQFNVETPQQLFKLLATMVQNRIIDKARHFQSAHRDMRRNVSIDAKQLDLADSGDTPSMLVGSDEVIGRFRELLTDEERYLLDQRVEGRPWAELAQELSASSDQLRKRLTRATARIAAQLRLGDGDDV
jgi:RNA polymerase sigma factor (sigma-70 family)